MDIVDFVHMHLLCARDVILSPAHQVDWVSEHSIFLHRLAQQWGRKRNEIWHNGSLGDEDDAQTLNTCTAQRKHTIPHSTMRRKSCLNSDPLPFTIQHLSYGDCVEVTREYYQNCSVLDCVTQCSQSAAHLYEQFLQVQQIGFVTLGPLCCV